MSMCPLGRRRSLVSMKDFRRKKLVNASTLYERCVQCPTIPVHVGKRGRKYADISPLKCSGIIYLYLKLFNAIQV